MIKTALNFITKFITHPITWLGAGVAAPVLQNEEATVITTTVLVAMLGWFFCKWEFRCLEVKGLRVSQQPTRKVWWFRLLDFTIAMGAFAGIWFSTYFLVDSTGVQIEGDRFLVFSWVLLMFITGNLYVASNKRYNLGKRFMAGLLIALFGTLQYLNVTQNLGDFTMKFL